MTPPENRRGDDDGEDFSSIRVPKKWRPSIRMALTVGALIAGFFGGIYQNSQKADKAARVADSAYSGVENLEYELASLRRRIELLPTREELRNESLHRGVNSIKARLDELIENNVRQEKDALKRNEDLISYLGEIDKKVKKR